jgi:hypothetical protein
MAIQEMGFGKVVLICVVAAFSTFAATGIAIVLAGASSESAIVIVVALAVLLVPIAKFVSETWKWLSWKEAKARGSGSKANRATAPGAREMGHGQRASRFQHDRETQEDTSLVAQAGYLERAPSSSETASAAVTTDAS